MSKYISGHEKALRPQKDPDVWISGKKLIEKYNIDFHDLLDHIENGLPVYKDRHDSTREDEFGVFFNFSVSVNCSDSSIKDYPEGEKYLSSLQFKTADVEELFGASIDGAPLKPNAYHGNQQTTSAYEDYQFLMCRTHSDP